MVRLEPEQAIFAFQIPKTGQSVVEAVVHRNHTVEVVVHSPSHLVRMDWIAVVLVPMPSYYCRWAHRKDLVVMGANHTALEPPHTDWVVEEHRMCLDRTEGRHHMDSDRLVVEEDTVMYRTDCSCPVALVGPRTGCSCPVALVGHHTDCSCPVALVGHHTD